MNPYVSIFLLAVILSCNKPAEKTDSHTIVDTTENETKKSMKGFDLYVWRKEGKLFFTLLPGTNREKTSEEIYDPNTSVEGMSAIENKINEIASGEYIFIKTIDIDTNDIKPLMNYMKIKKLNATVIPQSQ